MEDHAVAFWRPEWNRAVAGPTENLRKVSEAGEKFTLCGRTFVAHPDVFSPRNFTDEDADITAHSYEYFVAELTRFVTSIRKCVTASTPRARLLELGCGCGCISVSVALNCSKLDAWAVDVSSAAVANATENASINGVADRYFAQLSDLFSAFENTGKTFDVIYFNWPFVHQPPPDETDDRDTSLDVAFFNPYYTLLHRVLQEVHKYLADGGRLLMTFSKLIGVYEAFEAIVHSYKWKCEELACMEFKTGLNFIVDYRLYELSRY